MNNEILTSIQTSKNISAANGRSGNIRLKTPRIEQKIQLTIIAAIIIYSTIFLIRKKNSRYSCFVYLKSKFCLPANDQYL